PTFTIGGACASGNLAMREGLRDIQSGESLRSVVCGPPFDVSPADIHASAIINAVVIKPEYQDRPEEASRPFDVGRCGFLYSHGAATLVLEDLDTALKRGAPIYGEILGVKAGGNANHLPMPGAENQTRVMMELMKTAGIKPEDVDYVNCHATGTPSGDLQEVLAIQAAFGSHAKNLKINAPKSMLGHTCWGSPLVETVGALLQMKYGRLHPTINIEKLDPAIKLNVITKAEDYQIELMLKNSFGFGGINCCSLIKRYKEGK
ncbi:MAG: beta-ketoacyl-ACP synthase, partial [Spirochaeta sp. LUC14_002_19_P3]